MLIYCLTVKQLSIFFIFLSIIAKAQIDSAISVPLVGIHFGGQLPGGDLLKRFGPALNVGGAFMYKTNKIKRLKHGIFTTKKKIKYKCVHSIQ